MVTRGSVEENHGATHHIETRRVNRFMLSSRTCGRGSALGLGAWLTSRTTWRDSDAHASHADLLMLQRHCFSSRTWSTQNSAAPPWADDHLPPHAACVAVHLASSPCCVGHSLTAFCPYHPCLPRYKALANYSSSRRSLTLRSRRRLHRSSGLPTAWQTGPAQHMAYPTRHIFFQHSP